MTEIYVHERLLKAEQKRRRRAEIVWPIIGGLIGGAFVLAIAAILEVVRYG